MAVTGTAADQRRHREIARLRVAGRRAAPGAKAKRPCSRSDGLSELRLNSKLDSISIAYQWGSFQKSPNG